MESAYVDELKASINLLMANLESLPVTKGSNAESKYSLQKFKKYSKCVCSMSPNVARNPSQNSQTLYG